MTKREWFDAFTKNLSGVSENERRRAKEYYEELFDDKKERGMLEEDIIDEFGDAEAAARKVTEEAGFDDGAAYSSQKVYEGNVKVSKKAPVRGGKTQFTRVFEPVWTFICLMTFLIAGAVFGRWGKAWTVFLLIPVGLSLERAIRHRRFCDFAYPVFAAFLYLIMGLYLGLWHPGWIIFVTIPFYYIIFEQVDRNTREAEKTSDEFHYSTSSDEKRDGSEKRDNGKFWLIFGIVAMVLTICVLVAGAIKVSFSSANYDFKNAVVLLSAETPVTEVTVDGDVHGVFVYSDDVDYLTVDAGKDDNFEVKAQLNAGVINVTARSKSAINFFFSKRNLFIRVIVPKNYERSLKLSVKTNTSEIEVKDLTLTICDLTSDTGATKISSVKADVLSVETDTGSVKLKNVEANELKVIADTGAVTADEMKAADASFQTDTGAVKCENAAFTKVLLKSNVGSIRFSLSADEIKITNDVGSVRGTVRGKEEDYNVAASSRLGSCNLKNTNRGADKSIEISVDVGSVDVVFY